MRFFLKWLLIPLLAVGGLTACKNGDPVTATDPIPTKMLADLPAEKLQALSSRSFYFGHQSVGKDITDGLAKVLSEHPNLKLNIVEGENAASLTPGVFLHSRIGKNREPNTKIQAFEKVLDSGIGTLADAAFVKFCYVDATHGTDVNKLFTDYKSSVESLKSRYPKTVFIHFTMPLRTVPDGIKANVKRMLGSDMPEYMDNANRTRFNELLRAEYAGKAPVFDIARLESMTPAKTSVYQYQGQKVEALSRIYTSDGGHLSDEGKRWIAEQLLVFLAELNYKS